MNLKSIPTMRIATQRGVSLTIVLILLLIMTLLGLASMRGALLQEQMTSGQYDRSLGFQAAEAALREAEAALQPTPPAFPAPAAVACTADGLCAAPLDGSVDRWDPTQTPVWRNLAGAGRTPPSRYIIEFMGTSEIPNPRTTGLIGSLGPVPQYRIYRITAQSQGADRARVLLQTNYSTP
jgi:type IV pilus assembly protein PilX